MDVMAKITKKITTSEIMNRIIMPNINNVDNALKEILQSTFLKKLCLIISFKFYNNFLQVIEKNNIEEFYIRRNASAVALAMDEFYSYSKEKWK